MCCNYNGFCNNGCFGGCSRGCGGGCGRCGRCCGCGWGYRAPYFPPYRPFPIGPLPPAPTSIPTPTVPSTITRIASDGTAGVTGFTTGTPITLNTTTTQTGTALTPTANGVQINAPGTYAINYSVPLTVATDTPPSSASVNLNATDSTGATTTFTSPTVTATGGTTGDPIIVNNSFIYTVPANASTPINLTLTGASGSNVNQPTVGAGVTPTLTVSKIA